MRERRPKCFKRLRKERLENMNWYLFGGYTAIWTVLFVLLVFLNKKQRLLADEIQMLSGRHRSNADSSKR